MAIFTKDGKTYTVQGPNPIVNKQASWEKSKLKFHNFEWDEIRQSLASTPKRQQESTPKKTEKVPEPAVEPAIEENDARPSEDEPQNEETPSDFEFPHIKYRVLCHCLPARAESISDPLYGDTWTRVKYGAKFVFPCVVVSSSDLSFEFWTSDPKDKVSEKSVIYPFSYEVYNSETSSYDKVPYDDYRWWRVSSKESREGGWSITANPSDFQPDFSD